MYMLAVCIIIIKSGHDNPVINNMSINLHIWKPITCVHQANELECPIPFIVSYDKYGLLTINCNSNPPEDNPEIM